MQFDDMNVHIVHSLCTDPYRNLAFEEALLTSLPEDAGVLFLWQNRDTVVIGLNQNPWAECNLAQMEADGVLLTRRITGGGAVFHDIGNLNFSFILPNRHYDVARQGRIIVDALGRLGIMAEVSGRNDITADGRKFSGNAFSIKKTHSLHHGTLLIGADMSRLSAYLNVSADKLQVKGVKSVRARVINLAEINPEVTVDRVRESVAAAFADMFGKPGGEEWSDLTSGKLPQFGDAAFRADLDRITERNASWDWRFGKTHAFTATFASRFAWGGVSIGLVVTGARVEKAIVHSDSLVETLMPRMAEVLAGADFHPGALAAALRTVTPHADAERDILTSLADWLQEQEIAQ